MKVLDLLCTHGHVFEGWFASEDDFAGQLARGLLECPVCGSAEVEKRLSAPRLNLGRSQDPAVTGPVSDGHDAVANLPVEDQARFLQAMRQFVQATEDVGDRFVEEARRIHQGEAQQRGIRGRATRAEAVALMEEGIGVLPLPDLPMLKDTLQ